MSGMRESILKKLSPRVLSPEQVASYHREGMLVVRDFFTKKEEAVVVGATDDIQAFPEEWGKQMIYFEPGPMGGRQLYRTENYIPYHPGLRELLEGKVIDAVSDLLGEPAVLFKEKINWKFKGAGGFGPHQDSPAYCEFPQKTFLSAMISADQSTMENGCLEMVRGKHRNGIVPQNSDGTIRTDLCEQYEWEPLLVGPADICFFSADTPHRSGRNNSQGSRRAHFLTFNPESEGRHREAYFAEKRKKFPPLFEMEPGKDYSEGARIYNAGTTPCIVTPCTVGSAPSSSVESTEAVSVSEEEDTSDQTA
uniref:Fe2OG dioxygenase domain-containing protein n=1 Tax=Chromera velia CCMP2878 TaxID=1169474 RepID=A0A0G4GVW5_9ALVE|eukprot:Cvel_23617.t1-p1 / transcript=Cvel_23617.t1 / gene=Cvel_23617 / organism=Chromera_velia_CCMP2878 / gene_product=hypothetical protein / transcript_product=hypothetical protein / location=Cvel_scaffold2453:18439-19359(-) / protein_length=307 / sequence_SO=supercontig / SO=protein_coding / is_pseudo=false